MKCNVAVNYLFLFFHIFILKLTYMTTHLMVLHILITHPWPYYDIYKNSSYFLFENRNPQVYLQLFWIGCQEKYGMVQPGSKNKIKTLKRF